MYEPQTTTATLSIILLGADLVYEYETQQSIATLCMLYYDHGFMYIL